MHPTPAIRASGLVKHFGDVRALDGVDLEAREATVLGLLGPNGAGKTTAVRVLTTLLEPDAGSATVVHTESDSPRSSRLRMPPFNPLAGSGRDACGQLGPSA